MTDGDRLLRTILDDPDEDAPRLVYADWCDENGEPELAEFIRVQVELAGLERVLEEKSAADLTRFPLENRLSALRRRERGLLAGHGFAWLAVAFGGRSCEVVVPGTPKEQGEVRLGWKGDNLPPFEVEFCRGFVGAITLPTQAFLDHAAALFAAQPVTRVTLEDRQLLVDRGSYCWERSEEVDAWPWRVPAAIVEHWPPGAKLLGLVPDRACYATEADALAALSAACVAFGRAAARLPALVPAATS